MKIENHLGKFDHLFKNIIPNSVGGIKIFSENDSYKIIQQYDSITKIENKLWSNLYQKLEFILDQYASKEYLIGLRALPIPNNKFPEFDTISPIIKNTTGWELIPVAGFLDEELFFKINTNHRFPVTDIIRESPRFDEKYSDIIIQNESGYTPEPDIFHDVQGHVPFLMNKDYAQFMWEIGVLGYEIIKDEKNMGPELVKHNLKRLQNFAWWTYEYGLLKNSGKTDKLRKITNDIGYEIYGAGIISSFDEVNNVVNCAKGLSSRSLFKNYDIEEIVMTCFDYSNIQDRYFVVDSMEFLYKSFKDNKDIFWFEG